MVNNLSVFMKYYFTLVPCPIVNTAGAFYFVLA
jgi:hypothetical protein